MTKNFDFISKSKLTFSVCDPVKYPYALLAIICFLYFYFLSCKFYFFYVLIILFELSFRAISFYLLDCSTNNFWFLHKMVFVLFHDKELYKKKKLPAK